MKIHFVGDGELDGASLPILVETILKARVESTAAPWARLNQAKGFAKKIVFATLQAQDQGADGLVAVVDKDKARRHDRLKDLKDGRDKLREKHPPFPTALGEATPHGESWLFDDAEAVRKALSLPMDIEIRPLSKTKDPKSELESLIKQSRRSGEKHADIYRDIAAQVDLDRCRHVKESGFHAFREEVKAELGSVKEKC